MTLISRPVSLRHEKPVTLYTGDRMTQEEFHRAYEQTEEGFKAELIGGIVYVASPLSTDHGDPHVALSGIMFVYRANTPGTQCCDNTTVILGENAEPQPDLFMRILPEFGGQSETSQDKYVAGPPELIVEVALSSRSIDLHAKRADYLENGVLEYVVVCVEEGEVRWFDLQKNRELTMDADKICRIRTFPGLWIDSEGLFKPDDAKLLATAQRGLATPEHAEFVAKLAGKKNVAKPRSRRSGNRK